MSAIDNVMVFWDVMSTDEKKELILRIGEKALEEGIVSADDIKPVSGKKKRKGSYRPFWIKTAERIDPTKKGMFRVEGNWVNDVRRDVAEGNLVIVGTKAPKHYWVGKRQDGATMDLINGLAVENIAYVTDADNFSGIETALVNALAA